MALVPPIKDVFSKTLTLRPPAAALRAADKPADPEPITSTSRRGSSVASIILGPRDERSEAVKFDARRAAAPSWRGKQHGGDAAILAKKHIVEPGGRSRRHGFETQPRLSRHGPHRRGKRRERSAQADHQNFDRTGLLGKFGEDRPQTFSIDLCRARRGEGADASRRRHDRAAMGHAGEAESAGAIGLDGVATGDEAAGLVDHTLALAPAL